jgi:hypothetical protein
LAFLVLFFKAGGDAAHGILAYLHTAQRLCDSGYLAHRDPREVHLQDRLLYVSRHPLVSLEDLCYELTLPVARHL